MKKTIILALLIIIPAVSFAQAPENLEEAKGLGVRLLEKMPQAFKEGSDEFIYYLKKIWNSYVVPAFKWVWSWLEIEVEEESIKKELKKEKEEMKQEIPKAGRSLWERFKDLIK